MADLFASFTATGQAFRRSFNVTLKNDAYVTSAASVFTAFPHWTNSMNYLIQEYQKRELRFLELMLTLSQRVDELEEELAETKLICADAIASRNEALDSVAV